MNNEITIFGKEIIEESAIIQIQNCMLEDSIGVLSPDAHMGYSMPIGGSIAYKNHISPTGVGYDIGCGNMAVKTDIKSSDINISKIMNEIFHKISFGMGRPNDEPIEHEVLDKINDTTFLPQAKMVQLAKSQLGTVGGGNHYVDIFKDEDDNVWIGVHFGSRGFGHKTASGFMALYQGLEWGMKPKDSDSNSKPILFDVNSEIGRDYIQAMNLAGEYAYAGRETVVKKVLGILGAKSIYEVHNHHNFAWKETHFGEEYWVVRKGATPAFPGQQGFIGANMMDKSVIIEGVESEDSKNALYSTVHGAGRILSRTKAAGKKKWIRGEDGKKRPTIVAPGLVDFDAVKAKMDAANIILKGAAADEAPQCYKNLSEVLSYMSDNVKILYELTPIGIAMASDTEYDPYKD